MTEAEWQAWEAEVARCIAEAAATYDWSKLAKRFTPAQMARLFGDLPNLSNQSDRPAPKR